MGFLRSTTGYRRIFLVLLLSAVIQPCSASAAEPKADREQLMGIARQFVDKISKKMKQADDSMAGLDPQDVRLQSYFDSFQDGEPLVLQLALTTNKRRQGDRFMLEQPVTAIKQGHDVMISLIDFVGAVDFPIKVDGSGGTADGWFIREDQPFHLDINTGTVTIQDKVYTIETGDVEISDGDLLVKGQTLARWFGFDIKVNLQGQNISVASDQTFPIIEKLDRLKKRNLKTASIKPEQPYVPQQYKAFTPPRADISLREIYRKTGNGVTTLSSQYSMQTTGDMLGHSARSNISGDNEESLNSVRLGFSKESENADLLGPLKASLYEFNDVRTVKVPLAGTAAQERGFHLTNKSLYTTLDTVTTIDGDALPGWDVELYRGQQYIEGITVGIDGRYSFENIPLFAGDNNFRVVQYGPQGELREEAKTITVAPALAGARSGLYDVSLSQNNTQTYNATPSKDPDKGAPHFAGTYERQVGDNLTLRGGVQARQENEQQDMYFYTGAVTVFDNTIYNADLVTAIEGPFQGVLTGRRRLGKHSLSGIAKYSSEDFSSQTIDEDRQSNIPAYASLAANARGPFLPFTFKNVTYDSDASILRNDRGDMQLHTGLGLSSAYKGLRFSNALDFQANSYGSSLVTRQDSYLLSGASSVNGTALGIRWRNSLDYEIEPELHLKNYNLVLNRSFTPKTSGELDLRHQFETNISTGTASMNYTHDKATISPIVSYDTDKNLQAQINVRFGLAMNPYTHDIVMSNMALGGRGSVSAFVFLDKNGDGVFGEDDEPLQDVLVKAVQSGRLVGTDEKGEAFLYDLPVNRVTDIVMEENSSFDPSWVPGFKGISIRPRAGDTTRIEFPILRGAEIDGTAYMQDTAGNRTEARNVKLVLSSLDGNAVKEAETPYDGFYVLSMIPPGVYYLHADTTQSSMTGFMIPKKIVITTEGGEFYGKNLTLLKDYEIPFSFRSVNSPPPSRTNIIRPEDIESQDIVLHMGEYRSRLSMALAWYKFKLRASPWNGYFTLEKPLSEIAPDAKTALMTITLKPKNPLSHEQAASVCQDLIDRGFKCGIETITTFRDPSKVSQDTENKEKNSKT